MEPPLPSANRTFICTVVFVDIVEYSRKPVSVQVEMKNHFNAMLSRCLEHVPTTERIILDTGDGAALCLLGDPEDALFAANTLRDTLAIEPDAPDLGLRIGINLGPVKMVRDINGQPNIVGDGINVAQRVMSFADPNQILVSRSYFEVVSRLSQEYSHLFRYLGQRTDKHVREHEIYEVSAVAVPQEASSIDTFVALGGMSEPAGAWMHEAQPPAAEAMPAAAAPAPVPPAPRQPEPPPAAAPARAIDDAALNWLEARLVKELGPVGRVLLRKSAAAARDLSSLCQELARHIPDANARASLLDGMRAHAAAATDPPRAPTPAPAAPGPVHNTLHGVRSANSSAQWPHETLELAQQRLAQHVGPMARVLVRRAAEQSATIPELYALLGQNIDNPRDREAFVALAGRKS